MPDPKGDTLAAHSLGHRSNPAGQGSVRGCGEGWVGEAGPGVEPRERGTMLLVPPELSLHL